MSENKQSLIAGLPLVQIVSGANQRVLAINSSNQCVLAESNPADSQQLWQLVAYPDQKDGLGVPYALVIRSSSGEIYCLNEANGSQDLHLGPWSGGLSAYFQLGDGISIRRNSNYCLTIHGNGPWNAGAKVEIWDWQNNRSKYPNQYWSIRTVA